MCMKENYYHPMLRISGLHVFFVFCFCLTSTSGSQGIIFRVSSFCKILVTIFGIFPSTSILLSFTYVTEIPSLA